MTYCSLPLQSPGACRRRVEDLQRTHTAAQLRESAVRVHNVGVSLIVTRQLPVVAERAVDGASPHREDGITVRGHLLLTIVSLGLLHRFESVMSLAAPLGFTADSVLCAVRRLVAVGWFDTSLASGTQTPATMAACSEADMIKSLTPSKVRIGARSCVALPPSPLLSLSLSLSLSLITLYATHLRGSWLGSSQHWAPPGKPCPSRLHTP